MSDREMKVDHIMQNSTFSILFQKVCSSASEIDIMTNIDSQTITGYFFFQT